MEKEELGVNNTINVSSIGRVCTQTIGATDIIDAEKQIASLTCEKGERE